jgi:hypothetical protein
MTTVLGFIEELSRAKNTKNNKPQHWPLAVLKDQIIWQGSSSNFGLKRRCRDFLVVSLCTCIANAGKNCALKHWYSNFTKRKDWIWNSIYGEFKIWKGHANLYCPINYDNYQQENWYFRTVLFIAVLSYDYLLIYQRTIINISMRLPLSCQRPYRSFIVI